MIHFDAKRQKSEAKTKVKYAKFKWKNWSETKIKRKQVKKIGYFRNPGQHTRPDSFFVLN